MDAPLDPELAALRAQRAAQLAHPAPASVLDHPVEVTDASFASFVKEHKVAVVDCWAAWCGPCRIVAPIVDALAKEMKGRVAFGKLDVDHNPKTQMAFGVMSIPTLLVFRDGKPVDALIGAAPKAMLAARIERALAG
ncbi:MAG: thioredoxin [Thermoplasmatota archaeon]